MSKVTLGQVAYEVRESTKNPSGLPVVGLEHLTPGDVQLAQWSEQADNTFSKVFHKGQVLFGRRRAYQKKAAVAPFDGVCSGDITVIAAKSNRLLPELLPFIVSSDRFFDYAMEKSAGSLSPRVKWAQLAEFELDIPDSFTEQRQLADLLWAMERSRKAYKALLLQTDELVKSRFVEMFGDPVDNPMGWPTRSLTSIGTCKNGMNFHAGDSGVEINCLGVGDFKDFSIIPDTSVLPKVSLNAMPEADYLLQDGDIVFVRSNGNKALVGRCLAVYPGSTPTTFSGFCIRFRSNEEAIRTEYLLQVLKTDSMRKRMQGRGANIQNLNQQILSSLAIPLPPNELQRQFLCFLEQTDKSKLAIRQALESLEKSRAAIMTKIFG